MRKTKHSFLFTLLLHRPQNLPITTTLFPFFVPKGSCAIEDQQQEFFCEQKNLSLKVETTNSFYSHYFCTRLRTCPQPLFPYFVRKAVEEVRFWTGARSFMNRRKFLEGQRLRNSFYSHIPLILPAPKKQ